MSEKTVKVLQLIDHDFEDLELWYPVLRLREAGVEVHIAGEKKQETYIGKYGVPAVSDCSFLEENAEDYDALLVPGGWAPDKLRRYPAILKLVQEFNVSEKPIGQICHAGWVLISAKILTGRKVTSTPGIRDDMENAGAIWLDEPAVIDGHIVSSRRPPDLPQYMLAFLKVLLGKK
ncbi:type 1 glutamine amidotransferase domain-containing protein [Sporomusa sp.]|uniref:type 1 glutamine amidotransferase domain-containing protein n=1 Tax=Sporomusa sp. TaxID=2078658 RepID=UPI002B51E394|nr:type 1 glutamine amidotransferase domain-containing protein [Sporomusa sp.]HWR43599.1 type 1 glutamine amidotransferase domain-containing protein [Sporomusa sp.]